MVASEDELKRALLPVDCTDAGRFELPAAAALELVIAGVGLVLSTGAVVSSSRRSRTCKLGAETQR